MKLYEFEGKRLLQKAGFSVPQGVVADSPSASLGMMDDVASAMVKAQVLSGRRGRAGGVRSCASAADVKAAMADILGREFKGESVEKVLVEERLEIAKEYYVSVVYERRVPTVIVSSEGGMDVEKVRFTHPEKVVVQPVSITQGLDKATAISILGEAAFGADAEAVAGILVDLYAFVVQHDALIVEINPLIKTQSGEWYLADAKIELDDEALFRQGHLGLEERSGSGRPPSKLEQLAHENDLIDNRGAAGRMFYEIEDGNIVVLAAGGGTSSAALDALFLLGGRPAVFTEHSGNPTAEKVSGIARIALMYEGAIDAIWVVGGRANFTDIYETLVGGVMEGIRETTDFDKRIPIIIRRAGPRDEDAFAALREIREKEGYNISLRGMGTSVLESARMVIYLANKHYMERKKALL